MSLIPTPLEYRARALADLRMGLPIVITGDQMWLVCAAESVTGDRLTSLRATGPVELALSRWRAETLKAQVYFGDVARLDMGDQGAQWCHAMADPTLDLAYPMKGPFRSIRHGTGDAAKAALAYLKAAHLLPAALMVPIDHAPADLTKVPMAMATAAHLTAVSHAAVPIAASQAGRVHVFRPDDGGEDHYAIEIGTPDRAKPVLVRLHSACFTGDVLGSLKCDCGPQLQAALAQMGAEGAGVLLYLNQEGRGIGLANKMRAYALQSQGFDTVEANHRLGFEDDERDFQLGAHILQKMGFSQVRLMTNNPLKLDRFNYMGMTVTERVPLKVGKNPLNAHYLATKAQKS
ncbi:MAG: GTP cyclohydrolase II, partial [Pseudomonadota bacterium]